LIREFQSVNYVERQRPDHAQYIAPYLCLLKEDSRAIFRAATAASEAAAYVLTAGERQQTKAA